MKSYLLTAASLGVLLSTICNAQTLHVTYDFIEFYPDVPGATAFRSGSINSFQQGIVYYSSSRAPYYGHLRISPDITLVKTEDLKLPDSILNANRISVNQIRLTGLNQYSEYVGCITGQPGFFWAGSLFNRIPALVPGGSNEACPTAINDSLQVAGYTQNPRIAFIADLSKGPAGWAGYSIGDRTNLTGINSRGDVTGSFSLRDGSADRGFVRTTDGRTTIINDSKIYIDGLFGTILSGFQSAGTFPAAVNARGEVVGTFLSKTENCPVVDYAENVRYLFPAPCRRAFYYYNGEFHVISPLDTPGPAVYVTGINDNGWIFGYHETLTNGRVGTLFLARPRGTASLLRVTSVNSKISLPEPSPNVYYRITASHSNDVLDVSGNSCANGTQIIQFPFNGNDNQLWAFQPTGRGTFTVLNKASQKVLDVYGAGVGYGTRLVQWPRIANALNQEFRVEALPGGAFRITAAQSGRVLDIEGASTAPGRKANPMGLAGAEQCKSTLEYRERSGCDRAFDDDVSLSQGFVANGTMVDVCAGREIEAGLWRRGI